MSIIRHCFAVCIRGIFQQSNKTVCIIFYSCWSILCNESEWRSNKMEPVWLMCQVISWAIFKGYCPFKGVKRIFLVLMLVFSMIMKAPECWYFSLLDRFLQPQHLSGGSFCVSAPDRLSRHQTYQSHVQRHDQRYLWF